MSHNLYQLIASAAFPVMGGNHLQSPSIDMSIEITTLEEPWTKDEKVNNAVMTLIPAALERKHGILVIQRDYGRYTVRVDQEVPCGMTYESSYQNPATTNRPESPSSPTDSP